MVFYYCKFFMIKKSIHSFKTFNWFAYFVIVPSHMKKTQCMSVLFTQELKLLPIFWRNNYRAQTKKFRFLQLWDEKQSLHLRRWLWHTFWHKSWVHRYLHTKMNENSIFIIRFFVIYYKMHEINLILHIPASNAPACQNWYDFEKQKAK